MESFYPSTPPGNIQKACTKGSKACLSMFRITRTQIQLPKEVAKGVWISSEMSALGVSKFERFLSETFSLNQLSLFLSTLAGTQMKRKVQFPIKLYKGGGMEWMERMERMEQV